MIKRAIFFTITIFYSCSFVSANAVEKTSIKALPLCLLLGATQLIDTMGKPLAHNISNISTTVVTNFTNTTANITNTTTNVISEILKKLVMLQQNIQQEENIRASQINAINKEINTLFDDNNFFYNETKDLEASFNSFQAGIIITLSVVAVLYISCMFCSSKSKDKTARYT
jgi:predicted PurR-regulated permease PerM